jgi:hypothetical protein
MDLKDLAKRIRETCIEAALQAYEDAGIQGLCAEGRWEAQPLLWRSSCDRQPTKKLLADED